MASQRSRLFEPRTSDRLADVLAFTPTAASYNTTWRSITVETFDLPSGETPEYCLEHYVVSVFLGSGKDVRLRRIIENQCEETTLSLGSVAICPIHQSHFFELNDRSQALCLNLNPNLLRLHSTDLLGHDRVELLPRQGFRDGLIQHIGLALNFDLQQGAYSDRLYAETLANTLALHLLRHYSTVSKRKLNSTGGFSPQKLKLVTNYINDNLERDLSLQELAAIAQLSQYHFCRLFKRSTGLSPHKYVTHQRVEKAKRLLKQGSMTLAEIAMICGFNHQSHLHRHFKRQTGVTPKTWLNS